MNHREAHERFYDLNAINLEKGSFSLEMNRNHIKKIKIIADLLKVTRNELVLGLGIGGGSYARWLMESLGIKFFGVDMSTMIIKRAKLDNVVVCDGDMLPFKDNTFDAVFCSGILHHFPYPDLCIKELIRVLKKGRQFVILEANAYSPPNFINALVNDVDRNILHMSKNNLRKWAESNDLDDIKVSNYLYTPSYPTFLFSLYDNIDRVAPRIPGIRNLSVMILLTGKKK